MGEEFGSYIYILVEKAEVIVAGTSKRPSPYCEVQLGQNPKSIRGRTRITRNTVSPVWNQVLSLRRPPSTSTNEPLRATFSVYDKSGWFRSQCLGMATTEVGLVPIAQVKDVCLEVRYARGEEHVRPQFTSCLDILPGNLHLKISSGHSKRPPDFNALLSSSTDILPSQSIAPELRCVGSSTAAPQHVLEVQEAQKFIYVEVIRASNLVKRDSDAGDPFCKVSINDSKTVYHTNSLKTTQDPVWRAQPFTFPCGTTSRLLTIEIFDDDVSLGLVHVKKPLGVVQVHIGDIMSSPGKIVNELFAVRPNSKRLQAEYDSNPSKLGKINIRYQVGFHERPPASSIKLGRFPLGELKVEVLDIVELRQISLNAICLQLLFEGLVAKSKPKLVKGDKCELNQGWTFPVTEICSDLTIELWDRDTSAASRRFGKVVLPMTNLWRFCSASKKYFGLNVLGSPDQRWDTWLLVSPAGKEDQLPYVCVKERPKHPVACVRVALTLSFNIRPSFVYFGHSLEADNAIVTKANIEGHDSVVGGILVGFGRLVDALLSPVTSALAVTLYLQSWKCAPVNFSCLALVVLCHSYLWTVVDDLFPLLLGISVLVQGYVLRRIRTEEVPTFMYFDERAKFMEVIEEYKSAKQLAESARQLASDEWTRLAEEQVWLCEQEVKSWKETVIRFEVKIERLAALLEKAGNMLNWKDDVVSFYSAGYFLLLCCALNVIWVIVLWLLEAGLRGVPFDHDDVGLVVFIFLLSPVYKYTAPIIANIDGFLLGLPFPLTPISWGSVPRLTRKYKLLLEDLEAHGQKAQQLRDEMEKKVQQKEREAEEQMRREAEEEELLRHPDGLERVKLKRLRESAKKILSPHHFRLRHLITFVRNLYSRSPSNVDHDHRYAPMLPYHAPRHRGWLICSALNSQYSSSATHEDTWMQFQYLLSRMLHAASHLKRLFDQAGDVVAIEQMWVDYNEKRTTRNE
eukprot:gene1870-2539_t